MDYYRHLYKYVVSNIPDKIVEMSGGSFFRSYLRWNNYLSKFRLTDEIRHYNFPIKIGNLKFNNPFGFASGWADSPEKIGLIHELGAGLVTSKTITYHSREGNPYPRLIRGKDQLINSMGLPNRGLEWWAEKLYSRWETPRILSIRGDNQKEWEQIIELLDNKTDIFELNFSCPNVHDGVMDLEASYDAVVNIASIAKSKIWLKLSPEYSPSQNLEFINKVRSDIDGISCINTIPTKHLKLGDLGKQGGLSGDPLYTVLESQLGLIRKTYPTSEDLPIFAMGGIINPERAWDILTDYKAVPFILSAFLMYGPSIFTKFHKYFHDQKYLLYEQSMI